MSKAANLQPCPFCGADKASLLSRTVGHGESVSYVRCGGCGVEISAGPWGSESVIRWNEYAGFVAKRTQKAPGDDDLAKQGGGDA